MSFLEKAMDPMCEPMCVIAERVVITGGGLRPKSVWMPREVRTEGSAKFAALHSDEYAIAQYFAEKNTEHARNQQFLRNFLDHLRTLRNAAVDAALLKKLRESDCMCASLPKNARKLAEQWELPNVVDVSFPAMVCGASSVPAINVQFILELNKNKVCCVELSVPALSCLRVAGLNFASSSEEAKRRRTHRERLRTGCAWIKPSYPRKCLFANYCNADGRTKRLTAKVANFEDEDAVTAATDDIYHRFRAVHHAMDENGELGIAADLGLDMFAEEEDLKTEI